MGFLGLLTKEDLYRYFNFRPYIVLIFSIFFVLFGISFFLMLYVQGKIFSINDQQDDQDFSNEKRTIRKDFEKLREELFAKFSDFKNLDDLKQDVLDKIDQQVGKLTEDKIIEQVSVRYHTELSNLTKLDLVDIELNAVKHRIEKETARISRYGYINLMIGFITTFMAIFFLGYSLLNVQTQNISITEYIFHFIPRLSLSILIELFSFFFLKLYKINLEDIKYFNNERTNLEMKIVAIKTGLLLDDKSTVNKLLIELSKTERNFVLKKGESTVEIEKNKMDRNGNDKLLSGILKLLERK
jgi:hypothetical protein